MRRRRSVAFFVTLAMTIGGLTAGSTTLLAASASANSSSVATVAKAKKAKKLKAALKKCKKKKSKKQRKACEKRVRKHKHKHKGYTVPKGMGPPPKFGNPGYVGPPASPPPAGGGGGAATPPPPAGEPLPAELGAGPREAGGTKAIEHASEIPTAPAFTPAQLNAYPSGNWIGPEGGTTGDHYSQLSEINTTNVKQLKGDWMTQLDNSGVGPSDSAEASPTVYDGVLYYITGVDDVFAVSAASGKILWVHPGNIPTSTGPDICCGWDARGLAIGDGMVFTGTLDGSIQALNQQTGKLIWKTEIGQPSEGLTITSAPLYYQGMVFIGPVGSEYGVRGFMAGLNATNGSMVWKHYNIPAPGEFGHETWPTGRRAVNQENEAEVKRIQTENGEWKHGGATNWNAPTVDPKRGLILYSTANAGNDSEGYYREGANLWAVSMLALNYKTGEMKWGYQEVHHDIWDYDASNQPTMINVEIGGKKVEGIVQANKDGYAYFVNDEEGKPVFPIEEQPVPTNPIDKSYPTQPIPTMPPFYPQKLTEEELAALQKSINEAAEKKKVPAPTLKHGGYHENDVFAAWAKEGEPTAEVSSDALSGDNEAPSSYDPQNGYYYVCSRKGLDEAYITGGMEPVFHEGQNYAGASFLSAGHLGTEGYLTAYDMHTGELKWTKTWAHECYSGITTTAGNLLFVGNPGGELLVYNATTGEELTSFQLGATVGGPESVYEYAGKERIGVYAGGNEFDFIAGNIRGDFLWQLSLTGTKEPLEAKYYSKAHAAQNVPAETTDY